MTSEWVTRVIDGDTFETNSGSPAVRLAGVDTPESGKPGFLSAKHALKALVLNKWVDISLQAYDVYGRRIAIVWVNGTNVNEQMKRYPK